MKVNFEIDIQPLAIPDHVYPENTGRTRQSDFDSNTLIPLGALDSNTLWKLCNAFKIGVFKKAGVQMPPEQG